MNPIDLPGSFTLSTLGPTGIINSTEAATIFEPPVPLRIVDLQSDLDRSFLPGVAAFMPNFEYDMLTAITTGSEIDDIPEHERQLSATSRAMLAEGLEDVRNGRVRILTSNELDTTDIE